MSLAGTPSGNKLSIKVVEAILRLDALRSSGGNSLVFVFIVANNNLRPKTNVISN